MNGQKSNLSYEFKLEPQKLITVKLEPWGAH